MLMQSKRVEIFKVKQVGSCLPLYDANLQSAFGKDSLYRNVRLKYKDDLELNRELFKLFLNLINHFDREARFSPSLFLYFLRVFLM